MLDDRVEHSSLQGIAVGSRAAVLDSSVHDSKDFGIVAGSCAFIGNNDVTDSGKGGVLVGAASTVIENRVVNSGAQGINTQNNFDSLSIVSQNLVQTSGSAGLAVSCPAAVTFNSIGAHGTGQPFISTSGSGCAVIGNEPL